MSNILYKHHIYYQPNKRKAASYAVEMRAYLNDYLIDRQAEDYYLQFIGEKNAALQSETLDIAIIQITALKGTSLRCKLYKSILEILKGFMADQYDDVIHTCYQSLDFFCR